MTTPTTLATAAALGLVTALLLVLPAATLHPSCSPGRAEACAVERARDRADFAAFRMRLAWNATRAGDVARQIAASMPDVGPELHRELEHLAEAIERTRAEHVDPPGEGLLIEGAIDGLMRHTRAGTAGEGAAPGPGGLAGLPAADGKAADLALAVLGHALAVARARRSATVTDRELIEAAIRGMLMAIDPNASYLTARQWRAMQWHRAATAAGPRAG